MSVLTLPRPALADPGPVATRLIAPREFPISWRALIANGCDVDHPRNLVKSVVRE